MSKRANGSLVKENGKVVGSSLIGQNFTDKDGNALVQYFQPRPSNAGDGVRRDGERRVELGPSNPNLIGNVPGRDDDGSCSRRTSTRRRPTRTACRCRPPTRTATTSPTAPATPVYEKNKDGSYVCDPNTVPERTLAYRALNGLAADVKVPVDAVTASASGLDPQITRRQRPPAGGAGRQGPQPRPSRRSTTLIAAHTQGRQLGVLGEQTVNVLELNLALDRS